MMAGQMRQPEDRQEPMTSDDMTITATERARCAGELLRLVEHGATITIIGARHGWSRSVISPPPQLPGRGCAPGLATPRWSAARPPGRTSGRAP